ncbi:MAG: glycosyl hydrolase, partial [Anaerolineae bacterium]
DFTPHLPALWYEDEPDAARHRAAFKEAINHRLEETFYRQLHDWCAAHGTALVGHPARGDDIGLERYFDIPGQDLVWRWVLPDDPSALEGAESTQAKCSSSAMIHLGRRRNSNECFGAYGHGFTWEEMKWLVDWCFVRGVNLLYPHAFFYSVRGPRRDERPPDVGPNSAWWDTYRPFADYCRRMCWLNTEGHHVCDLAILGESSRLPWAAAKVCYQHQRDFNYLEARHLWEDATVSQDGIRIAGMHYRALIVEGGTRIPAQARPALEMLCRAGRVIAWGNREDWLEGAAVANTPQDLVAAIDALCPVDLSIAPHAEDVRYRHVVVDEEHLYILCNEGMAPVSVDVHVAAQGIASWVDPWRDEAKPVDGTPSVTLAPYTTMILCVTPP